MKVKLPKNDAELYSKIFVSKNDIEFAKYCNGVLLKKGWHNQPWERRGTIYQQQSAFTSALITAYGRPFTQSKGWPKLPPGLIPYNDKEYKLHKDLITLRHKVYAHSDSENYTITPWQSEDFATDIVRAPALCIKLEDAILFENMADKLMDQFDLKMKMILAAST